MGQYAHPEMLVDTAWVAEHGRDAALVCSDSFPQVTETAPQPLRTAYGRLPAPNRFRLRCSRSFSGRDGYVAARDPRARQRCGGRLRLCGVAIRRRERQHLQDRGREAAAGHPFEDTVAGEAAVRVFTGAVMPAGLDTVAMQEDVRVEDRDGALWASVPAGLKRRLIPGWRARIQAGRDAHSAERLRPQDVASAAATGLGALSCYVPLKVVVFSTGDEFYGPRNLRGRQVL